MRFGCILYKVTAFLTNIIVVCDAFTFCMMNDGCVSELLLFSYRKTRNHNQELVCSIFQFISYKVITQSCDLWFGSCAAKFHKMQQFNKSQGYSTLRPTGLQIHQGHRQELKSLGGGASPSVQSMLEVCLGYSLYLQLKLQRFQHVTVHCLDLELQTKPN